MYNITSTVFYSIIFSREDFKQSNGVFPSKDVAKKKKNLGNPITLDQTMSMTKRREMSRT